MEKNIENKPTEELNKEPIERVNKKAKIEKSQPVRKLPVDSKKEGSTSKGFIIEETSENIVKSGKEPRSNSAKKKGKILTKAKESTTKKVLVTEKIAQKKASATIPRQKQKTKLKKTNTKSSLLNKGGITKKIVKPQQIKTSTSTYAKKPSITDERLRAFGLNPKKFHKKQKYGNKSTVSVSGIPTNAKNVVTKNNKLDKLNQKKIKQKLLKVLGT